MTIKEQLQSDMKLAMKVRATATLASIRLLLDRVQKKEKDILREATDSEISQVIQTYIKQTEEELEYVNRSGNLERVDKLNLDLQVATKYLPKQLSREEVIKIVKAEVEKISPVNMKSVMQAVMPILSGKADNKVISQVVKEIVG